MSLFAIADTHLSLGTNKPMDTFEGWQNYTEKLKKNWNNIVSENDFVVLAGDISWAINFEELIPDFAFIHSLNGNKIILKGNHDYWWNTVKKMNEFLVDNNFNTIQFLYNNAVDFENFSVCGSRGWMFDTEEEQDEKLLNRELIRLEMSLKSAKCDEKIVFLHYPPVTTTDCCEEIFDLLLKYGIKKCYYGHLHGVAAKYAVDSKVNSVDLKLISADRLEFVPYLIKKF